MVRVVVYILRYDGSVVMMENQISLARDREVVRVAGKGCERGADLRVGPESHREQRRPQPHAHRRDYNRRTMTLQPLLPRPPAHGARSRRNDGLPLAASPHPPCRMT